MSEHQKKILVTGGTGFIGSALVKRLVGSGYKVRVLDNNIRGAESRLKEVKSEIELIEGDIRNYEEVRKACIGIETVHQLAYVNGTEHFYSIPEVILEIAVKGMMNVIDACKENNVREMFVASSSETYQDPETIPTRETERLIVPDPFNPRYSYGGGKILWELMAINFGRKYFDKVIIYRPHNVYGPDMGWEHVLPQFAVRMDELNAKVTKGVIDFPIQGSGKETRAFVYIDDFIDGVLKLVQKGQHLNIYNIGSMEEISIQNLAYLVARAYNREIIVVPSEVTLGSTHRRCPDTSKISSLGYLPKVSLDKGVNLLVDWYKNNKKPPKKVNKI